MGQFYQFQRLDLAIPFTELSKATNLGDIEALLPRITLGRNWGYLIAL